MDNTIIIGFNNEKLTYELPRSIIKKYPNSIFSLYEASESTDTIIISDITYDQFRTIYEVILNNITQWSVPPDIIACMDKYGLINDTILKMQNYLNANVDKQMTKVHNFLNHGQLLLTNNFNEYYDFKNIFNNNKNIMSVQMFYVDDSLRCINILESIPIYYNQIMPIPVVENIMDINMMRYKIIIDNHSCKKCVECNKCKRLVSSLLSCKKCMICDECKTFYYERKNRIKLNKKIYSTNTSRYLNGLCQFINDSICIENMGYYQQIKSKKANIISWSNIAPIKFLNNITTSFEKIRDTIISNNEYILNHYNNESEKSFFPIVQGIISCCDGPIHIGISTFNGFVNINNII